MEGVVAAVEEDQAFVEAGAAELHDGTLLAAEGGHLHHAAEAPADVVDAVVVGEPLGVLLGERVHMVAEELVVVRDTSLGAIGLVVVVAVSKAAEYLDTRLETGR